MPLESATYIHDLVAANPVHTDGVAQADSHMRLIKTVLQASFPNITGPVTASPSDLNSTTGMVAAVALKAPIDSPVFTGVPVVPTAAPGVHTTQAASTAFVAASFATIRSAPTTVTTPGTFSFVVPAPQIEVELWGGGSGSWASVTGIPGGGGSGGGYTRKLISGLVVGATIPVTVGIGGTAGTSGAAPGAGGLSSFGSYCSASGGAVNPTNNLGNPASGNLAGVGTGGDLNLSGGDGSQGGGSTQVGGHGGGGPLSGGGPNSGTSGKAGFAPGGGASGAGTGPGGTTANPGAAGAPGAFIARW